MASDVGIESYNDVSLTKSSGYYVPQIVGSEQDAKNKAEHMTKQGFPSFIQVSVDGGETWNNA